jgi:hypothetical protein
VLVCRLSVEDGETLRGWHVISAPLSAWCVLSVVEGRVVAGGGVMLIRYIDEGILQAFVGEPPNVGLGASIRKLGLRVPWRRSRNSLASSAAPLGNSQIRDTSGSCN